MKAKRWLSMLIATAWMIGSACQAQPPRMSTIPVPSPLSPGGIAETQPTTGGAERGGLSDWIVYRREGCEGGHGHVTPLYTELYLRAGPSLPVGGMTLSRELKPGWSIAGGARALFFNEEHTRAWVVDAHLMNTNETGGAQDTQFPLVFFQNGIRSDLFFANGAVGRTTFSILDSNRTMVGLGLGRVWYPWAPADSDGRKWRWGVDAGGRYGSHRVNFNEFGHITDVAGGVYAGIHTDIERPWRGFLWSAGFRFEWAYTWSDALQGPTDVQDLNLYFSVGLRY